MTNGMAFNYAKNQEHPEYLRILSLDTQEAITQVLLLLHTNFYSAYFHDSTEFKGQRATM